VDTAVAISRRRRRHCRVDFFQSGWLVVPVLPLPLSFSNLLGVVAISLQQCRYHCMGGHAFRDGALFQFLQRRTKGKARQGQFCVGIVVTVRERQSPITGRIRNSRDSVDGWILRRHCFEISTGLRGRVLVGWIVGLCCCTTEYFDLCLGCRGAIARSVCLNGHRAGRNDSLRFNTS